MILPIIILLPFIIGLAGFLIPQNTLRRALWLATACTHLVLTIAICIAPVSPALDGWLAVDSLAKLFLMITSILFLAATVYGMYYMHTEGEKASISSRKFIVFHITREAMFTGFLLIFLATMSLVTLASHLGVLWIAVEATTLASAPLIYFHRHHKSLEATWKYLMVCSVGIALALLGIYFFAAAATLKTTESIHLTLAELLKNAGSLEPVWLKAAFLLILVGFGTKMGLVPMHTWLPEAHSEAPSLVSALLSGALLNCSFLAILRIFQIMSAAHLAEFACRLLLIFGLISMLTAAFMLISKRDYKRMLAYSSIENMGIIAVGIGLGAASGYGTMLHTLNHSLVKAALFLIAGNILIIYKSKKAAAVQGLWKQLPASAIAWTAGILAITGTPPFSLFTSKLLILKGAIASGNILVVLLYLGALIVSFIAIATIVFKMLAGDAPLQPVKEKALSVLPSLLLLALVLGIGLWIPQALDNLLKEAAGLLGGIQ